jgi:hypothetical protein
VGIFVDPTLTNLNLHLHKDAGSFRGDDSELADVNDCYQNIDVSSRWHTWANISKCNGGRRALRGMGVAGTAEYAVVAGVASWWGLG